MNRRSASGFALITGLILLGVLTLVALIAMRNTGLELRISENHAQRIEMFEVSETSRALLGPVVDAHVFARGWPASEGGSVANPLVALNLPTGMSLRKVSGVPPDWFGTNPERVLSSSYVFSPQSMDVDDADYQNTLTPAAGVSPISISSRLGVYKLRVDLAPGAGAAMVAGYEGPGKSAAAGGGNIFLYLGGVATGPENESAAVTGAVYRHVITN